MSRQQILCSSAPNICMCVYTVSKTILIHSCVYISEKKKKNKKKGRRKKSEKNRERGGRRCHKLLFEYHAKELFVCVLKTHNTHTQQHNTRRTMIHSLTHWLSFIHFFIHIFRAGAAPSFSFVKFPVFLATWNYLQVCGHKDWGVL